MNTTGRSPGFQIPSFMPLSSTDIFGLITSFSAAVMLAQTVWYNIIRIIPEPIQARIYSLLCRLFKLRSSTDLTLTVEQHTDDEGTANEVYEKVKLYLQTKISGNTTCLRLSKTPCETKPSLSIDKDEKAIDIYDNIELRWRYYCEEPSKKGKRRVNSGEKRSYVLRFPSIHKDKVLDCYMQHVYAVADAIKEQQKVMKIWSRNKYGYDSFKWESTNFDHPSTFETLAIEPELKKTIVDDLDRFLGRKGYYQHVGKAWKRGYLLYGPPGTGKSSLIAAISNYLRFDIYDLQLSTVKDDADLKKTLLSTTGRSILVIEDIDCSVKVQNREKDGQNSDSDSDSDDEVTKKQKTKFTLSGLLNFIDGLWSCCGNERIIVFTTNYKDQLDPALLRPGRMDKHILMSYCTPGGFKVLASNYLGIGDDNRHPLCEEVEALIASTEVTPAEVAEELMLSDDADVALQSLVEFIKRKKVEVEKRKEDEEKRRGRRRIRQEIEKLKNELKENKRLRE